jgi:hypothetical protein
VDELLWAASSFRIDSLTALVTGELEASGVRSVLLKGPAIAEWLYPGRGVRVYGDTDLLISPDDWERAIGVLQRLGFEDDLEALGHPRMESITSYPWKRGEDDVDLHTTLWGIAAPPSEVWRLLSASTSRMRVGGRQVDVLSPGPRALHIALHAAQHGHAARKPMVDLEMALSQLPDDVWAEAADVARRLDATAAFVTALELTAEGSALAGRLGVEGDRSVNALLRQSQVPLAEGFHELATTPGLGAKAALVRRELLPTPEFMRWWSPLAKRGPLGLAVAYVWRVVWFVLRAPRGLFAWRKARRDATRR